MKKIILFAAACVALAACNKENATKVENKGYKAGETVTIGVTAEDTKVSSTIGASKVDFVWNQGDQVKVIVDDESAIFTLSSGAGTSSATFTGTWPAEGETYTVKYPTTSVDPTTQTYREGNLPTEGFAFKAVDVTVGQNANMKAEYAAICLNFTGTIKVGKINFKGNASNIDLNVTNGVTLDSTNPTPFYMFVPKGEYGFTVEVYDNNDTKIQTISSTSDKQFGEGTGKLVNMETVNIVKKIDFTIANPDGLSNVITGTFTVDEGTTWGTFTSDYNTKHPDGPKFGGFYSGITVNGYFITDGNGFVQPGSTIKAITYNYFDTTSL